MTTVVADIDLRNLFGPVRDQGPRPTCLAFAASDLHAAVRPGWIPLSCEAAFYHAQRRAGRPPSVGASLGFMLEALREDGQPAEDHWPYAPATPANDDWAAPPGAADWYSRDGRAVSGGWEAVVGALEIGRPALLLLRLSASFFRPGENGVVRPDAGEVGDPALGHAVVAVGCGHVGDEPALLVRNSWGTAWGTEGHAWLSRHFVVPRLYGLALLEEEDHVPACSAAA